MVKTWVAVAQCGHSILKDGGLSLWHQSWEMSCFCSKPGRPFQSLVPPQPPTECALKERNPPSWVSIQELGRGKSWFLKFLYFMYIVWATANIENSNYNKSFKALIWENNHSNADAVICSLFIQLTWGEWDMEKPWTRSAKPLPLLLKVEALDTAWPWGLLEMQNLRVLPRSTKSEWAS